MLPRYFLNDPVIILWILIFHDFSSCDKSGPIFLVTPFSYGKNRLYHRKEHQKLWGTPLRMNHLINLVMRFHFVKGCPGKRSGGTPPGQSGGSRWPGGECFAPCLHHYRIDLSDFGLKPGAQWPRSGPLKPSMGQVWLADAPSPVSSSSLSPYGACSTSHYDHHCAPALENCFWTM